MKNLTIDFEKNSNLTIKISKTKLTESLIETFNKYKKIKCDAQVNIHLISDEKIKSLNKKYRNIDKSTDVLSFGQATVPNQKIRPLGDIFIAYNIAKIQAKEKNCSQEEEIILLACHGLKHLMGIHHR